jgi:hypothetical protein
MTTEKNQAVNKKKIHFMIPFTKRGKKTERNLTLLKIKLENK